MSNIKTYNRQLHPFLLLHHLQNIIFYFTFAQNFHKTINQQI